MRRATPALLHAGCCAGGLLCWGPTLRAVRPARREVLRAEEEESDPGPQRFSPKEDLVTDDKVGLGFRV